MRELEVNLGERSYPIYIGPNLLQSPSLFQRATAGARLAIITDTGVAPLYLDKVINSARVSKEDVLIFPRGEANKNLTTFAQIMDFLLQRKLDRRSILIALGGGVVGDLVGFAAACYQRGIGFIQVPTTLLAQVDSSVGGKTGINHPLGKNMIGAFHQPICVIIDSTTLVSLDEREISAGLAEVIKYAVIEDPTFFNWLEQNLDGLLQRDPEHLAHAISVSCQCKARIVSKDERETGVRAILNFGHTFGHAFEATLGYGALLHGEAVGLGMRCASKLSLVLGLISNEEFDRIDELLDRAGLPRKLPRAVPPQKVLDLMKSDKKAQGGEVRFILINGIGSACSEANVEAGIVQEIVRSALPS